MTTHTISDLAARLDAVEAKQNAAENNAYEAYMNHMRSFHQQDKAPDAGDEATIDALMRVESELADGTRERIVKYIEDARDILQAISAGKVPGIWYNQQIATEKNVLLVENIRLKAELSAEQERAESAIAETNRLSNQYNEMQKAGSIDHLRKLNKEANEARAELNNARTLTEATRQDLVKARIERDAARSDAAQWKERAEQCRLAVRKLSSAIGNPCVQSEISLEDGVIVAAIRRLDAVRTEADSAKARLGEAAHVLKDSKCVLEKAMMEADECPLCWQNVWSNTGSHSDNCIGVVAVNKINTFLAKCGDV